LSASTRPLRYEYKYLRKRDAIAKQRLLPGLVAKRKGTKKGKENKESTSSRMWWGKTQNPA